MADKAKRKVFPRATTANEYLLFRTQVDLKSGCHEYTSYLDRDGYGKCSGGKSAKELGFTRAHRLSYYLAHGEIPKGMLVLHKCDNRKCINTEHLFLGVDKDNIADMYSKNRQATRDKLLQPVLSKEAVLDIKSKKGKVNYLQLAKENGVGRTTIYRIWNNEYYVN